MFSAGGPGGPTGPLSPRGPAGTQNIRSEYCDQTT